MHITFLKDHKTEYREYKQNKSYFVNDFEALEYLKDKTARISGREEQLEEKKETATKAKPKRIEKAGGE